MKRSVLCVVVLCVVSACGRGGSGTTDAGTVPMSVPGDGAATGDASSGPVAEFEVADVEVPDEVTRGVEAAGGATIEADEWSSRFPTGTQAPIPTMDATTIEAASEFRDGERLEERSWMLIDDRDRFELIEDMRALVDADSVVSADNGGDDAGDCSETVATGDDPSTTWTFRACDYHAIDGMHAVGIVWSQPAAAPEVVVDPTIELVLSLVDGTITSTGARLQVPDPGENALVRDARVEFAAPVDPTELGSEFRSAGMTDWALQTGDGSVILTGPRGETWTVTDRVALFEAGGPW